MFVQGRADGAGERIVTSASDLTAASACEFGFLRRVDARLGRDVVVPPDDDPMLARAAVLGDAHEERVLVEYRARFGEGSAGSPGGVVEIARCDPRSEHALEAAAAETRLALDGRAEIVFQATFFDPAQRVVDAPTPLEVGFVGFADFLRLLPDGSYEVQDTKLARRARVTALMQLAAYAEQLERIGIIAAGEAVLILGDGSRSSHPLSEIAPVFRARRERLHALIIERVTAVGADGERASAPPLPWATEGVVACGRCEVCAPEIERTRDPLLIAGMRRTWRDALIAAGCTTIDAVAVLAPTVRIDGIADRALERIVAQAAVQVAARPGAPPPVRVVDPTVLGSIPAPNPGDLFFDFEGDPLYEEAGEEGSRWGLDYLFGMIDTGEVFRPLWAHDLEQERRALLDFLELVGERRRRFPGMRIYHYAAYERTHLLSIAARHGVGEDEVDGLLRDHVLVDLYPIVRGALRVGSRSYSIKKLEPLYMGDELRDEGGVTSGTQSVAEYAEARASLDSGDPEARVEGLRRLEAIADYNRYDCVSTLRLRDWLLALAREHGIPPHPADEPLDDLGTAESTSTTASALRDRARAAAEPNERKAIAIASSAIDYHRREQKAFWWEHFARLVDPIEDWADSRGVVVVDPGLTTITEPWHVPQRGRAARRVLSLRGEVAPGSSLKPGGEIFLLYEHPAPFLQENRAPGARSARRATIIDVADDGVTVTESIGRDATFDDLPLAVAPGPPPPAGAQKGAIEEWGRGLLEALDRGGLPRDPVVDLLLRAEPRFVAGRSLVAIDSDEALAAAGGDADGRAIGAVTRSLAGLDRSSIAVQGPPGTGKTYLAAHVIRRLVEELGWRVGVVAQSHRVVENVLEAVVRAGLDRAQAGKVPQGGKLQEGADPHGFTVLPQNGHARFLEEHESGGRGCVIGGTAWDFSNERRFGRRSLDLLVIDEAGQFSLAPTIAASVAAERLLLLGDPQQLPQVSQGTHPEPVDDSALGWLLGAHETIPETLGYFLSETRRMRPALADVVSELAYAGRLGAHSSASERSLDGAGPEGFVWHPVAHRGNATHSEEEAEAVVRIARQVLSGDELLASGERRALQPADLIVVAPYNAQVDCVTEALGRAGIGDVRVGTVDKFQGQEAAIAIVTLAASSSDDIPRGLEFLLMRNRLNVAISRARWAAHLVSSDRLGEGLPTSAEGLASLSAYLRLLERSAR